MFERARDGFEELVKIHTKAGLNLVLKGRVSLAHKRVERWEGSIRRVS